MGERYGATLKKGLCVEDHKFNLLVAQQIIERCGHRILKSPKMDIFYIYHTL